MPATLLLAVVMVILFLPSVSFAADHPTNGHKHVDVDIYHVPDGEEMYAQSDFPARWDPRNDPDKAWYRGNIQIKDQGNSNTCWACSAASAAETSYAKESNRAVDVLSPFQIAYFFYNRSDDPLNNTGDDKNLAVDDWNLDGGSCIYTCQHLATRSGMIADSLAPLSHLCNYYKDDPERTPAPKLNSNLEYSSNVLTLENCVFYDELPYDSSGRAKEKAKNTLKGMITEYGAAVVSMDYKEEYFKDGTSDNAPFFKPDKYDRNNHEVTIIGWDDNYSRDNFESTVKGYESKPKDNGAWIMQNSWGTEYGDNGYYYVSYESRDVLRDGILSVDMQPADASQLLYQYDGNAYHNSVEMYEGEQAANVFTAQEQIRLGQVAFTTWNAGETGYTVDVYTGLSDPKDPLSGIQACTTDVTTDTPGFKSFPLTEPVTVDAEETFAIVVTFHSKRTKFGVEKNRTYYKAGISPGQSFYREGSGSIWNDAANDDFPFCFRIKGIAEPVTVPCQHNYVSTGEVHEATVNEEGYTVYRCSKCGHRIKDDILPWLDPDPAKTSITKVTATKKAFTVKWKKDSELLHKKHITGYKVRYSLKSNMSGAKTVTVKGWTKTSKKVTGLKSGKKYYVQVQTYFNDDTGNYASDWSGKKTVKTK